MSPLVIALVVILVSAIIALLALNRRQDAMQSEEVKTAARRAVDETLKKLQEQ